jgi:hypothetical protein
MEARQRAISFAGRSPIVLLLPEMSTLKSTIESLAAQFATSILGALRSASIDEVMSLTGKRASAAASGSAASGAAAPAKRGPGRPKKAASAAQAAPVASAPKKRGRPAGSGNNSSNNHSHKASAASKKTASGRLARRSAEDIGSVVESIVSLLEQHSEGLRAEQIRGALGLDAKELPRPLADGLAAGTITKTGQKRATTYFAGQGKKRR